MGAINLSIRNEWLLLKNFHKFYKEDVPWVQLVWSQHYSGNRLPILEGRQWGLFGGVIF